MQPADVPGVVSLVYELAAYVQDPEPRLARDMLVEFASGRTDQAMLFVAEDQNSIVGFVLAQVILELHTGRRKLWISDFHVQANARRKGIGKALMETACEEGRGLGCDCAVWEVWIGNMGAEEFYIRLGAARSDEVFTMSLDLKPEARA